MQRKEVIFKALLMVALTDGTLDANKHCPVELEAKLNELFGKAAYIESQLKEEWH